MAKIVVTSDLHLGITPEAALRQLAREVAQEQPDLTVLAGDIGEGHDNFVACLDIFRSLPGKVAVLLGNHDVWARRGFASETLWNQALPEATRAAGMEWLEGSVWVADGVGVAGSLAWYDYSAVDPTIPPYPASWFAENKGRYNLDGRYLDWQWSDSAFADGLGDGLMERLTRLEQRTDVRAVLVVTHVPLVEEQMLRKPEDPRWGVTNAYFGNLSLGKRVLAFPKVRAICSGHTHVAREGVVQRPAGAPVRVSVLGSDYGAPRFMVFTTDAL